MDKGSKYCTPANIVCQKVDDDVMYVVDSDQVHPPSGGFFPLSGNRTLTSIPGHV